jgi:hypothetical protein
VALRNDIGQAVIDDDLDLDIGIVRQEPRKGGPQDRIGGMLARSSSARNDVVLRELGITALMYGVLLLVAENDGISQVELAERMGCRRRR